MPLRLLAALVLLGRLAEAAPLNDTCPAATVVPDDRINRFFDTVDIASATSELDEPSPSCTTTPGHTVWYDWTAPNDGQLIVINACTTPYDVTTMVWEGTCDALFASACGDHQECGGGSFVAAFVDAGQTYRIQVGTDVVATSALSVQLCFLGPDQDDSDSDLTPDCLDRCTDSDFDGFGDTPLAERPFDTCPGDNCPDVSNSDQSDKDFDGVGDACDTDEDKDEKTLEEAAEEGLVELSSKGCFAGDCVRIVIRNPGPRGLVVRVRRGDVLVSRDDGEQDLGITRPATIYVPPGGTVALEGLFTVCLELVKHGPSEERIYDVTDNLADVPDSASLAALLALFGSFPQNANTDVYVLQSAVWAITDASSFDAAAADALRAAGLDPAALPTGFPDLPNPNAGSTEPASRSLAGLLSNAPPGETTCSGAPLEVAACLVERVQTHAGALPDGTVKAKLRAKIGKRIRGVAAKVGAASRATSARKIAKLTRLAGRRANALARLLAKAAAGGKLPEAESQALRDAAVALAAALG
jgi:hypothetical protein